MTGSRDCQMSEREIKKRSERERERESESELIDMGMASHN